MAEPTTFNMFYECIIPELWKACCKLAIKMKKKEAGNW